MITKICQILGLNVQAFTEAYDNAYLLKVQGVQRLLDCPFGHSIYAGTSGGKDSAVICDIYLEFCRLVNLTPVIIHNKKAIVDPLTVQHLYSLPYAVTLCDAQQTCNYTQGRLIQVDGSRIAEAERTNGRSTDFICNGKSIPRTQMPLYNEKGLFNLSFIYPIYDWSDEQVWAYTLAHKLSVSKEYGDVYDLFN